MIDSKPLFDAPPAAILFDLDGTLADCFGDIQAAVNHGMRLLGRPEHTLEAVKGFVGYGVRRLLEQALEEDMPAVDRIEDEVRAHYKTNCGDHSRLYDGMGDLLAELAERGVPVGVVSNKPHDLAIKTLDDLNVSRLCDVIQGEDPSIARKPAPDMLLSVLGRLGVPAAPEVVMIGDGIPDIEAARAAGVRVVAVTWGMSNRADLEAARPDRVVDDATTLRRALGLPRASSISADSAHPRA